MNNIYSEYNVNYISGCMSLRPPQKRSLKILEDIHTHAPSPKLFVLKNCLSLNLIKKYF